MRVAGTRAGDSAGSTTMIKLTPAERAAAIGREHREAYVFEHGRDPVLGEVGDLDKDGMAEMWQRVEYLDKDAKFPECRLAYLKALFGTEDVT
jgi:hypothetical protein